MTHDGQTPGASHGATIGEVLGSGATAAEEAPTPAQDVPPRQTLDSMLTGLLLLAIFYTLFFARIIAVPFVFAVLLNFLLSPVVNWMKLRLRLPEPVSAGLLVLSLLLGGGLAIYNLSAPAAEWVGRVPEAVARIEEGLATLKGSSNVFEEAAEATSKLTGDGDSAVTVTIQKPSVMSALYESSQTVLGTLLFVVILTYFLLASGHMFLRKTVMVLPTFRDKRQAVEIARQIEFNVSRYLLTATILNASLGLTVGVAMWALGLPNPVLWGVLAWCLNYIPYAGPLTAMVLIALASLVTFGSLSEALVPPAAYFVLHLVEAFLLEPAMLGARLKLNPVVIVLALMFWGWLWGLPGALLAVPLTATIKIVCDRVERWSALAEFMGPDRVVRPKVEPAAATVVTGGELS